MSVRRTEKLNSLLQEVIAEVIRREVKNPLVHPLCSVTSVQITSDLAEATVSISVIGTEDERINSVKALNKAAGFIAVAASKKMVIRHFPSLSFVVDSSVDKQMHINDLIRKIADERTAREHPEESFREDSDSESKPIEES